MKKYTEEELYEIIESYYNEKHNCIYEEISENQSLDEGGEWKVVWRKGKRQRKLMCPPGTKAKGKVCKKMSSQERMKRRKALRRAAKKMKAMMTRVLKKRKKSLKKRKSAGL
tara:strand:- start:662 stop:997 length:336 start_codon:yes stop_codon:yes gene_type:complete